MAKKTLYALIAPKSIKVTETYVYDVAVAKNEEVRYRPGKEHEPSGKIEVVVPYDGETYFTEAHRKAIAWQTTPKIWRQKGASVTIGNLGFASYGATNLEQLLNLRVEHDTIALDVPICADELPPADDLLTDQRVCKFTQTYTPKAPPPALLKVEVSVYDEVTLETLRSQLWDTLQEDALHRAGTAIALTEHEWHELNVLDSFDPRLRLDFRLSLNLPKGLIDPDAPKPPVLEQMTLKWPVPLSDQRMMLTTQKQDTDRQDHNVHFLPDQGAQWAGISLILAGKGPQDEDIYATPIMQFSVARVGELYDIPALCGSAVFKLERPLSRLEVDLFDAAGNPSAVKTTYETKVTLGVELWLDEHFDNRIHTPFRVLQFAGILPDEMRVTEVEVILKELGFHTRAARLRNEASDDADYLVVGRIPQGTDELWLWLLLEWRISTTQRQRTLPGHQAYLTELPSSHLTIRIRGKYSGDYSLVVRNLDQVQQRLQKLFQHIRAVD